VYGEREKERHKERENRDTTKFFIIIFLKKLTPAKKSKKFKDDLVPGHQGTGSHLSV
jgi:hypothetical protein